MIIKLAKNDFRVSFRDPMMRLFFFMPFLVFGVMRWGWPMVVEMAPSIAEYNRVVLMWACMQVGTMFGFIYGFLFLEEKEDNIWTAIRVLPISAFKLTWARLMVGVIASTLANYGMIHWGEMTDLPIVLEFLLAFHFAMIAPLVTVAIAVFANNRIEGLAQTKVINLLTMIPGLIYFLPYKALHLLALIPTYWSMRSMELADSPTFSFWLFFIGGLVFYIGCIWWMSRRLDKSV